jgi:hypothetical protein
MSPGNSMAWRYHWHSAGLQSFVEEPHTAICGTNQGEILNLADRQASPARNAVLSLTREKPEKKKDGIPGNTMAGPFLARNCLRLSRPRPGRQKVNSCGYFNKG